jgi:hypothetical protein
VAGLIIELCVERDDIRPRAKFIQRGHALDTVFGSEGIMGTDVYNIVHVGRLPRPLLEQMAAFAKGMLYFLTN